MPAEKVFHNQISDDPKLRWASYPPVMEDLKAKAKELGLWNLWLSGGEFQHLAKGSGAGLTNLEYGVIAEICGYASRTAPEAMNCSAPDTGNMEVIARFGSDAQKEKYLMPLVNGKIRSSFSMTEYGGECFVAGLACHTAASGIAGRGQVGTDTDGFQSPRRTPPTSATPLPL